MADQREIMACLRGRWNEARMEPPRHDRAVWRGIAEQVREKTKRPKLLTSPEHHARRLLIEVLDRLPTGIEGECCSVTRIYFAPHEDQRIEGLRIAHGLAHVVLARWEWEHSEADAWHVTAEILFPSFLAARIHSPYVAARLQPWAPTWFLEAYLAGVLEEGALTGWAYDLS